MSVPFEIPEIFALICSFLIRKPRHLINFSRINIRIHQNLYSVSVWRQLGFNSINITKDKVDSFALTNALRNLDYKRVLKKSIKIQRKLDIHHNKQRARNSTTSTTGAVFANIRDAVNAKLGIYKILPNAFYDEYLCNTVLTDEHVRSIVGMIQVQPEYMFIPVLFDAFKLLLTKSKTEIQGLACSFATSVALRDYLDVQNGTVLVSLEMADVEDQPERKKSFLSDLFYFCRADERSDDQTIEYSCFIKFIGENKAVLFVAQNSKTNDYDFKTEITFDVLANFFHYWKLDLTTKKIDSYGSVHDLVREVSHTASSISNLTEFKKLASALSQLLECQMEDIYGTDFNDFLSTCAFSRTVRESLMDIHNF